MDIFDSLRVVLRWWFITIPILLLSLGAAFMVTSEIQPEYVAEGSVLIIGPSVRESPTEPGEFDSLNPLIDQPAALESVASVVALSIGGPRTAAILAGEGLSSDFAVGTQRGVPVVLLETRAESRGEAQMTAERLAELIDEEVQARQDVSDVPAIERVTTSIIQIGAVGGADYGGRTRMRIVVVALGVGMAFGAAFLLEGLRRRRMARRQDSNPDDVSPVPPSGAGPRRDVANPFTSGPPAGSEGTRRDDEESAADRAADPFGGLDQEASGRGARTVGRR